MELFEWLLGLAVGTEAELGTRMDDTGHPGDLLAALDFRRTLEPLAETGL
jgi:hypothetical protein